MKKLKLQESKQHVQDPTTSEWQWEGGGYMGEFKPKGPIYATVN